MWWNFVAASGEEIADARQDRADGQRFPPVGDCQGTRLAAPPRPTTRLNPHVRTR
jgi:quercetin 2,3-dioxygenase